MVKTGGTGLLALLSILLCYFISSTNCKLNITIEPRIINGEDGSGNLPGYFNQQALILRHGSHSGRPTYFSYYGGAILSETHVLTCAHCVTEIPAASLEVVVGMTQTDINDRRFVKKVEKIYIHEQYDNRTLRNDIALLEIVGSFTFNTYVGLIPFQVGTLNSKYCELAGYGKTAKNELPSSKLMKVTMDIMDWKTCKKDVDIGDKQICTFSNTKSVCGGDDGSPLKCNGYLGGIVSYAKKSCEPGIIVYSEVSKYLKWLEDHACPIARTDTSFASLNAPSSPLLNFIALLVIFFIGNIVGNL